MTTCPDRPTGPEPPGLDFRRKASVQWLSPKVLLATGREVGLSSVFARFADKREQQAVIPMPPIVPPTGTSLWLDYVADLGDGFDATATVASLLSEPALEVTLPPPRPGDEPVSATLHRGSILVMGGDEVYPFADSKEYEDRTLGPYRAVHPCSVDEPPQLYAIPGNHDWYDGLTSFLRIFGQNRPVGVWKTAQRRSYFAVQLPARWWLLGIDVQLDTYIDGPQLDYFTALAKEHFQEGDAVILCSAKPSWVEAGEEKPLAYDTLAYFERAVIRDHRANIRLSLTGDLHHYARYVNAEEGDQKITAGGGGAYLAATHHLPGSLVLPPVGSRVTVTTRRTYHRKACYPPVERSKALRWHIFGRIWRNRGFVALPALIYALLALGVTRWGDGVDSYSEYWRRILNPLGIVTAVAVVVVLAGFTKEKTWAWPGRLVGVLHAVVQLAVAFGVVLLIVRAVAASWSPVRGSFLRDPVALGLLVVVGGALGTLVFAAYLCFADSQGSFGVNSNELFAGMALDDHKCFVRLHLDHGTGALTVYPVKIDRVPRWRFNEAAGGEPLPLEAPWFVPDRAVDYTLLEPPITISHDPGPVG